MVAILEGRDALAALPTGFGKSLIYQVPAMILERPTIVVSPLIALMADQERALETRGVPVVALHSRLRQAERRAAIERLERGGRLVVLTTPETLESRAAAPSFERARPALFCVDEAHCISEWGARLPTVLLAARERPREAGGPAGARAHRDAACPRGCRPTASSARSGRAHRSGSPREPPLDGADRAWSGKARRLQALSRPGVRHLERLEAALSAWASEQRAPTGAALAYSAGVPARIAEVLLSDLEQAASSSATRRAASSSQ